MQHIQALRERRAAKAIEARKILDDNQGEGKWNATLGDRVDALYNEIDDLDGQIARHQRAADLEAETTFNNLPKRADREYDPNDPKDMEAHKRAFLEKFMRNGWEGMSQQEIIEIRNTMSTTTGSEGGFTVPSLISQTVYDVMKAYGAMRSLAEIIPTADGKPLSFPGSDGTAEVGEWIAQNTTATAADPVFTTVSLNAFKASSKIIAVPIELLQDSIIDIEAFIRRRIGQRIGRLGNVAFTTGAGTTLPDGVVPRASVGKTGTTGQTLTIIYDDIVDLVHSVDPAYRGPGCSFMTNDSLLKVIRKIKDTAGRPIWMPSYDQGISNGANPALHGGYSAQDRAIPFDYLLGFPVYVNNDLAVPAANAKSMTFGDHSYYKIRDVMDITLFRFTDSAYTKLGQVGFLAWARMGGNLVDTAAVKVYQHSAT